MQAGASPSLNSLFAASFSDFGAYEAARAARAADAFVRADAAKIRAENGADANTQVQYQYTRGADGQLYATGATVTTSKRAQGRLDQFGQIEENAHSLYSAFGPQNVPKTLGEISRPQAQMSSAAFAELYGSEQFAEEAAASVDAINRGKLQTIDFGVRSQERQHYNAAAGLGSAPVYDYEQGPDGELYAVAGSVGIKGSKPEDAATIARAALAATDVSAQDISVARSAQSEAAFKYASNFYLPDNLYPEYDLAA